MPAPTPKRELIATIHPKSETSISITVASPSAREWIKENAPRYGSLITLFDGMQFILYVNALYDASEVCAYLNEYAD